MPQRGKAGWNVEEWDPATAASNENMQQMEMLSPLSFLRGLLQQGLAGVYTRAKHQWPRQPALPSCQRVSLSLWFPVALMAACTCSLKILRPLPRYLLIQKSLPRPLPLLPRPWGHSTSHHPAEKFSLHKDGTEDSSWMCIIREAKMLQLYIVPAPLSTPSASQRPCKPGRVNQTAKPLLLPHCCCGAARWICSWAALALGRSTAWHLGLTVSASLLAEALELKKHSHFLKTKERLLYSLLPSIPSPQACLCAALSDGHNSHTNPRGWDPFGSRQGSQSQIQFWDVNESFLLLNSEVENSGSLSSDTQVNPSSFTEWHTGS